MEDVESQYRAEILGESIAHRQTLEEGQRVWNTEQEVAVEISMGLGIEAVTQKCIPKQSKSVSISGREVSEGEAGC